MRKFLLVTVILVSLLTLLISPLQVSAQKTDPESVLRALFDALNAKDVDGALALVTDDAVITVDQFVSRGKEEIRNWWEGVTAVNAFTQASNFQVDGDKATWTATVLIDPWRALELPPLDHNCEGIVQDGLVKSYSFIMTDNSMTKLQLAENTDPESVLRAVFGALNNKDIDGALALVADDATITIVEGFNQFVFTGKEEIRKWWELVITGENSITLVGNFLVDGDKAIWSARVSNDPWNALNVSPVHCHAESVVQGGLLKSHKFILSAESIMKIRTAVNKEIARRWVEEIWNKGDLSVVDEIVAEDYVDRSPIAPGRTDRESIKASVTELRTAFPDVHFTIDAMIAEGDKVVVPQTFTGTHQGELAGTPATGNQVTWTGIFIYRFKDGKIVERWGELDTLGFMIQIGAVPPPGEGGN